MSPVRTGSRLPEIALREDAGERTVTLERDAVSVAPRATWHRPSSAEGASLPLVGSSGTSTAGDRHDYGAALGGRGSAEPPRRPGQGLRATPA
ncbi:hypothetical protein ACFVXE_00290 [Streptomyces sp. NPDC058231]|uniref:hypothetical protein n=1 Tax=Streptomyces sp. NPDC058231 TaxID=3346392 RepID=UPI0036E3AC98